MCAFCEFTIIVPEMFGGHISLWLCDFNSLTYIHFFVYFIVFAWFSCIVFWNERFVNGFRIRIKQSSYRWFNQTSAESKSEFWLKGVYILLVDLRILWPNFVSSLIRPRRFRKSNWFSSKPIGSIVTAWSPIFCRARFITEFRLDRK